MALTIKRSSKNEIEKAFLQDIKSGTWRWMMDKLLPVGVDDFEKLITRDYYFVDKTLLIKELMDARGDVNLITRPRRFGKTLNLSMLRYFFEDWRDRAGNPVDERFLFDGTKIMDCGEKYLQHMGQYPVIQLSLKGAKRPDYASAITFIAFNIAEECSRHAYLLNAECLTEDERELYRRMMAHKADHDSYMNSLRFMSEALYRYHGKKAIILIDEYDVPLENAYVSGFYKEMVSFIRSFFENGLKTNPFVEFAVVTGCLRISKESIFTGMNNLRINSILSDVCDEYFGFTDAEVEKMCNDFGLAEKYPRIKEWYNGYVFGQTNVYNPWSVVYYMSDLAVNPQRFPESYWANTSSNSIVRKLIDVADREVRDEIEQLIAGGTVEKPVHEDITYDEVYHSMDNLWNFMFFTGYFRKVSVRMEERQRYVTLRIPNQEVCYIFEEKIRGWFDEIKLRDASVLFRAIREQDVKTMTREINKILIKTISYYDYAESFYHGFLAGILYGMEDYVVKSNRESGNGRTDLSIRPALYDEPAYLFEFKIAKKFKELEARAKAALEQIEEKQYDEELMELGYERIVRYGIAFFGKNCRVVTAPADGQ